MVLDSITAFVMALAVVVCAALVLLTTYLHRVTQALAASVESVHLAEEAQVDLLQHARTTDPRERAKVDARLRQRLSQARSIVTTPGEDAVLDEAQERIETYLREAARDGAPALMNEAHRSLSQFVDINVAESRQARAEAARWDLLADWLGIGCGALLLLASASLVWWVRVRAVRPLVDLARVMERFARGERPVRATEKGPAEVRQMAVRFNEMASALERQREAQMAFLGGVAHDLRNPLFTVRMSVETMPPDPQLARPLAILKRQVARLDRMIGDFLDMSRIESGRLELRLARHDARELVQNTVEQFQAISPGRDIELSLPDHEVALVCDGLRIEQVTANLVSNALKYSPADAPVRVALERMDGEARLVVADHGLGIAEEDQRRLFEPFRRVGLSAEAVPGVGLGLFVVRQIVEGHGGRLSLTSAPGRGSTFRVHLPLAPPATPPDA